MHKIISLWFCLVLALSANENVIVLLQSDEPEKLVDATDKYQSILEGDMTLKAMLDAARVQPSRVTSYGTELLQVGVFARNDVLALTYMALKRSFPDAVIIETHHAVLAPEPLSRPVQTQTKTVYVDNEVLVEKENDTMWYALFALALIGIVFMFLSSEQIKKLKKDHESIKSKHKKLEKKQHEVLSSMSENIHTIARETMTHTSILAEKVKETPLYKDMEKVMFNENELLDVTGDLIKFLRLKSKKVVIQHEVFNFNNVLNEVAGLLNSTYKQNDIELIFDIDKEVPRFMLADSLHLGQILTNLLEYFIQNSQNKEIKLEVVTTSSLKEGMQLRFYLDTALMIEDKEKLFESYYDEKSRRYVGLGLFVAKELTYLMDGELLVVDKDNGYHGLALTIPIEEKNKEKRKYRLPDKGLVGKKILIVDKNVNAAAATEKFFAYFRGEVTVLTEEAFSKNMPIFSEYEIVALHDTLFTFKVLESLKKVKERQALKIISLDNLFASDESVANGAIDISLVKPLTQEYVFDTLIELYSKKEEVKKLNVVENKGSATKEIHKVLPVYREAFKDVNNVSLESFKKFAGAHVLIVEDNIINQKVVMSVLGKSDMKLSVANNGEEAVEFVRNTSVDIDFIFMDINMPVMDGYRAADLIRQDNRFDSVAIVSLTALVSEHEIEKMFDSGMNGYLPKPVRIEKLYSALDMFVGSDGTSSSQPLIIEDEKISLKLDGLNVEEGLSRMQDNKIFYKEVLKEFMDAYTHSDGLFEKLVNEQRYMQVKMLCLDMKGLTGTIGAKEMHVIINEIHQHIIYKKPELLHSYISRYRETFNTLSKSIERYLET